MVLAHAAELIDVWGFAYAGGVTGLAVAALRHVRSVVHGDRPAPRWFIIVGAIAGTSIGLGTGRLLDDVFGA